MIKRLPLLSFLAGLKLLRYSKNKHFYIPNYKNPIVYPFLALFLCYMIFKGAITGAYDVVVDIVDYLKEK